MVSIQRLHSPRAVPTAKRRSLSHLTRGVDSYSTAATSVQKSLSLASGGPAFGELILQRKLDAMIQITSLVDCPYREQLRDEIPVAIKK